MLYLRFSVCLAVGLFGLAMVMSTMIDVLFTDWDVVADVKRWMKGVSRKKTRYVAAEDVQSRAPKLGTRLENARFEAGRDKQFLAPPVPDDPLGAPVMPPPPDADNPYV